MAEREREEYEQLHARISHRLAVCGYSLASRIEIDVSEAMVELRGTLPTQYQKQLAQDAVVAEAGRLSIRNGIRVERPRHHEK